VRIVSLNAWRGGMFDPLAQWLPGCGADVLCLQEVTRTPGLTGWTRFEDGERRLPQRADLFDDVRSLLPRHQAVFVTSDTGPVQGGDGATHRQDFGIAVLVDERLPVIGHRTAFVNGSYRDEDHWPVSDRPRVAHAIRVVDRSGTSQRTVTVVHLHGVRDPQGKGDTPARRAQAERLADLVDRARSPEDLVVVCGDLNLLPDSETFAVLREVGLVDLVGDADTRTSRYLKPVRHANYLLVSDPGQVKHFEVLAAPEVSDHRPLVLDL
jgi:endonuclease/exonuclease/phosphatase family metal-dependent hydrolase